MEGSDGRRCVPEAAAAAPPPPRPPPSPLPPPSSPPPPSLPPPPPTTATPAAALACQLLTWRQVSPPCPPPPVRPPSAPMRAPCPPVSHQRRHWRRSRHPLRLLPRDCGHTCHIPHCLTPLLLLHGRLWVCRWAWLLEAGVAADKSRKQEWPFAAVSGCMARPVVKQLVALQHAQRPRASCARLHCALCVWRRRLPPRSHLLASIWHLLVRCGGGLCVFVWCRRCA